jgi:cytochrome c
MTSAPGVFFGEDETMKTTIVLAAAALLAASGAAQADGAKLYAEKTCVACHGKDGKKP